MFIVAMALLGLLGVFTRYFGANFINSIFSHSTSLNLGLLFVNIFGSFLIGIAYVLKLKSVDSQAWLWMAISIGFLGALTTFSSYSLEVMKALISKQYILALNSFFLHNLLAIAFCFIGYWVATKALS